MKKLIFITYRYPYLPGEQFIEEEIRFFSEQSIFQVTVLPLKNKGERRNTPQGIAVDNALARGATIALLPWIIAALLDRRLYKEVITLIKLKKLGPQTFKISLLELAKVLFYGSKLREFINRKGFADIVYCYWNNYAAYAACDVYSKLSNGKIVSRIHGGDIYEDRSQYKYIPLKRQYISKFDKVYCLSNSAKDYLVDTYNAAPQKLSTLRLGVPVKHKLKLGVQSRRTHIVSCSFCTPIKRVDKIIESILTLAKYRPNAVIIWTHIGGGEMFDLLTEKAQRRLSLFNNVSCNFTGNLSNTEVHEFYRRENVDIFINLSESEGIPVSIIEAMSYGIPAIAPNIGGIDSLVNDNNGILLPENPSIDEAANALARIVDLPTFRRNEKRMLAHDKIAADFDSNKNYPSLIKELDMLTGGNICCSSSA
jgi:glycosyltransferase involved in cell wall biosynthesis